MSRRRRKSKSPDPAGVLVVDKPKGPTSARVVADVRRRLGVSRIGHTGTLDPMATGVLPLCLGVATKLASFLLADDKAYDGEIILGVETDTLDAEGEVARTAAVDVGEGDVRAAMAALTGEIEQVPPMFSALRSGGVRLHELARAGQVVEREARAVRVESFELTSFDPPRVGFRVACSKGTYVRSLARDLGIALGCGAHLSALRRTAAGPFRLADAVPLDSIDRESLATRMLTPVAAVAHLDRVDVAEEVVSRIRNGLQLRWDQLAQPGDGPTGRFSLVDPAGQLLAIAHLSDGHLAYDRVIPAQVSS